MKCIWLMLDPTPADPTQPIFHLLALGFAMLHVGSVRLCAGSARVFRFQHVGIPNAKSSLNNIKHGADPMQVVLCCSGISTVDVMRSACGVTDNNLMKPNLILDWLMMSPLCRPMNRYCLREKE